MTGWNSEVRGLQGRFDDILARHDGRSLDEYDIYADNHVGFIEEVLGASLWEKQADIVNLIHHNRLTRVRSAQGVGKTFIVARVILAHLYVQRGTVVVIAPTDRQVQLVWSEIRSPFLRVEDLPGELFRQALRIDDTERHFAIGFSARDAGRLTGFHHPRLLVVVDEAQALEPEIWEGIFALATGAENKIVAIGNPGPPTGKWYQINQDEAWAGMTISARDHPNVIEGREVIPGAVTRHFIADIEREYGKGSGVYQSRVLGEFADDADETLVSRSSLLAAAERYATKELEHLTKTEPFVAAVDPARYGPDSTVLAIRQGPVLREIVSWRHLDLMGTTGKLIVELRKHGIGPRQRVTVPEEHRGWTNDAQVSVGGERIVIDEVGVGGGIVDRLKEQDYRVHGYNGGRSPKRPTFANLRAESHWHLRTLLEQGQIALPHDEELFDELVAIRWRATSAGKIQIEPKEELKNRLGRSPDRADAVVLAFSGWTPRKARSTEAVHWG